MVVNNSNNIKLYITSDRLNEIIDNLANKVSKKYKGKPLVMVGILNGAFKIVNDLSERVSNNEKLEIEFIKLKSYTDNKSSGNVTEVLGIDFDVKGKNILIVEDLLDSGLTISQSNIINKFINMGADSVRLCALFIKKHTEDYPFTVDFYGKKIDNLYICGYGMDYNGDLRKYRSIGVIDGV